MIFAALFATFFKIGLFTFGGGYAMIPMIQQDVLAHGWLSSNELINYIAISEATPGPFAINIATAVGMSSGGIFGAFCATLGVVLPSFIIILIIARFFAKFSEHNFVKGILYGIRPAVIGLISSAALSVMLSSLTGISNAARLIYFHAIPHINMRSLIILCIIFIISRFWKKLHPIWLILISGILGIMFHLFLPSVV